ncbi:MAG: ATP-binding cassette domain-containing protein [Ruminococcaceae bacterium]|nr:ATP-binding cassette domain-containing protein [Oscillospiraceae bacterium]
MFWLNVHDLCKSYGDTDILKDVSFDVFDGEHVALVGANGAGKTTLFKLITGKEEYDSGEISTPSGAIVGVLDQIPNYPAEFTVLDVLKTAFSRLYDIEKKLAVLAQQLNDPLKLEQYGKLEADFDMSGGYTIDSTIAKVCGGLAISADMQARQFSVLSGGEKTRVNLARLMLMQTDALFLDEPTNHLDISSVEWLEDFISQYKGTVVIISHDRFFLDRTTKKTIELEDTHSTVYTGNYSEYIKQKEQNYATMLAQYERIQKEATRLADVARVMHERGTEKQHKTAFAIERRVERMLAGQVKPPRKQKHLNARFGERESMSMEVMNAKNISKAFGDKVICEGLDLSVRKDDRIALIGDNGCGKSTLLNMLSKKLASDSGYVKFGDSVKYIMLEQEIRFPNGDDTVLDTVMTQLRFSSYQQARDRLGSFGFSGDDVFKTLRSLSGGEKNRLHLCLLMKSDVNFLILDEPTNHLDIMSREWLEDSIDDFGGTLLFVSHDRYFINKFADIIWEMENGKIRIFRGTYEEYREDKRRRDALAAAEQAKQRVAQQAEQAPKPKGQKPKSEKSIERARNACENKILSCEQEIEALDMQINEAASDYLKLTELLAKREELDKKLGELYDEWAQYD